MKGFIPCAGVGSRLKPWTDSHPKALAPVAGKPMLKHIVDKLHSEGISDITVNTFHFADQIKDFIFGQNWSINISDESPYLLETGGALLHAKHLLEGEEPILVHNVDILSNANLKNLIDFHFEQECEATLLVSDRPSSRKLLFDDNLMLKGWHSLSSNEYKPEIISENQFEELAFGGIYIFSPSILRDMVEKGYTGKFSIIDYFLNSLSYHRYKAFLQPDLKILDIGKPESYDRAQEVFKSL